MLIGDAVYTVSQFPKNSSRAVPKYILHFVRRDFLSIAIFSQMLNRYTGSTSQRKKKNISPSFSYCYNQQLRVPLYYLYYT